MPITMHAWRFDDGAESDPDPIFDLTTHDPAAVLDEHFPGATYEFLHTDGPQWVFGVYADRDPIAVLYTEDATR
ncbi:hypothetical protein [Mycobacteroides abscessus]|uniref:hypothetical protein n=1 Tax=Mycobacteroides abscessus TaxID=36809 RepID=UPI0009A75D5C|nr:hypothetical protein [Mycobacteroides abscessus]SLJ09232.1 Uncharacterised protein [Mycobacteroides abscessus subsp. abscessus]